MNLYYESFGENWGKSHFRHINTAQYNASLIELLHQTFHTL